MTTFADKSGRRWELTIHVGSIARVKAHTDVYLPALYDDGFRPLTAFLGDVIAVANVLYVLCLDQAEAAGVSQEQFGCLLVGDVFEAAVEALCDELAGFSPKHLREPLRKVLEKARRLADLAETRAVTLLDGLDPAELLERSIASSGNAPASSRSTPPPSPSGSSSG